MQLSLLTPSDPPSYEELCHSTSRPALPATAGAFYHDHPGGLSIKMNLGPSPGEPMESQAWLGVLYVKCGNVPEMMKLGLFIGPENVSHEDGCMEHTADTISDTEIQARWPYTRHYYFRDLQEPPRWVAHMACLAGDIRSLADMHPWELSHQHVTAASAWAVEGQQIYRFDRRYPSVFINTIYDIPLQGLWPWPKATEATDNADHKAPHAPADSLGKSSSPQTKPSQQ
ncbi:hypothetical protein PG991_005323 [Apiospora marii]|uniref:Uncharacterized protein n=1 Tax=Apiospora marii TaxID=335849 RepID=A0ABR1S8U0_9PEZI